MLVPFYRCCSTPCDHPKPTLYDVYSLCYCLYPRTTRVVEFIGKVVLYFLAVFVFWVIVCVIFAANVDPWYG